MREVNPPVVFKLTTQSGVVKAGQIDPLFMRQWNVLTSELNMDQIECFDGVKLLQRSEDELLRRTGLNYSVFFNWLKDWMKEYFSEW
jgi:hypothetical protein